MYTHQLGNRALSAFSDERKRIPRDILSTSMYAKREVLIGALSSKVEVSEMEGMRKTQETPKATRYRSKKLRLTIRWT